MAIKTKDGVIRSEPICFTRDSSVMGITFELKDKTALFAPYAFLSHAQSIQDDEIVFHYSFGVVRVRGQRLGEIFALAQKNELATVNCDVLKTARAEEPQISVIEYKQSGDGE